MPLAYRILIASGVLLLDGILFFLPLTAVFLAYVILANPHWFRGFLADLDQHHPRERQP
jgi:hypothetical protein